MKPNAHGLPHTEANQPLPIALSEAQMCVARRELSVATSRALGVSRLLHLGLTRWRQSHRRLGSGRSPSPVVATRPSVATPGALRGAPRFVRGGGRWRRAIPPPASTTARTYPNSSVH